VPTGKDEGGWLHRLSPGGSSITSCKYISWSMELRKERRLILLDR
jgi:hypothetical protein